MLFILLSWLYVFIELMSLLIKVLPKKDIDKKVDEIRYYVVDTDYPIVVIKWIDDKHYYIKKNGKDVVINGKQKWNTIKEANEIVNKLKQENKEK